MPTDLRRTGKHELEQKQQGVAMPRSKAPNDGLLCGRPKKSGGTCLNRAGMRTEHLGVGACWMHGGSNKNANAAGKRELENIALQEKMQTGTYGTHRKIDPWSAMREELWRTAGVVSWLEAEVGALGIDDVTHLIVTSKTDANKLEVIDERANELIKLYQIERKHFLQVSKDCIGVGIAQRSIELAEQQVALINTLLRGVLGELGVNMSDPSVLAIVRKHLTAAAQLSRGDDSIEGIANAA